ncbi:MAG: aspartyl protease family protein [Bryobacteraceae bacterium]
MAGLLYAMPVANGVFLGARGPFRFLVDTGAQSTVVAPGLAAEAGLAAGWRVEVVTAAGTRLAPAGAADVVAGGVRVSGAEVLFYDPPGGYGGVLGQSVLGRLDYLLDHHRELRIGAPAPAGERLALDRIHDRPAVSVEVDGVRMRLVLDSAASHMVLFGDMAAGRDAVLRTAAGYEPVAVRRLRSVTAGSVRLSGVEAAVAPRSGREEDGLLPARWFRSVYVNNAEGYVILVGR